MSIRAAGSSSRIPRRSATTTLDHQYSTRGRKVRPHFALNDVVYSQDANDSSGWKCCNPRVLTFDEFMEITPCTTGVHSTTDKPPTLEEKKPAISDETLNAKIASLNASAKDNNPGRAPVTTPATPPAPTPAPPPESEDDDPSLEIPDGAECRRRKCDAKYKKGQNRDEEKCVFHPGVPIFHEGSKGYSCCKRRVLEFDQFLMIEGCKTKDRHMFVGSGKKDKVAEGGEEVLTDVRYVEVSKPLLWKFYANGTDRTTIKHPRWLLRTFS